MAKKTVIVSDSRTARMFIRQCFDIAGFGDFEILEASCGQGSMDIIQAHPEVSLVIIDVNMPQEDGISILKDMREIQSFKHVPVVVISSTQNPVRDFEFKALQVTAVLAKPLHLPLVAGTLRKIKSRFGI